MYNLLYFIPKTKQSYISCNLFCSKYLVYAYICVCFLFCLFVYFSFHTNDFSKTLNGLYSMCSGNVLHGTSNFWTDYLTASLRIQCVSIPFIAQKASLLLCLFVVGFFFCLFFNIFTYFRTNCYKVY